MILNTLTKVEARTHQFLLARFDTISVFYVLSLPSFLSGIPYFLSPLMASDVTVNQSEKTAKSSLLRRTDIQMGWGIQDTDVTDRGDVEVSTNSVYLVIIILLQDVYYIEGLKNWRCWCLRLKHLEGVETYRVVYGRRTVVKVPAPTGSFVTTKFSITFHVLNLLHLHDVSNNLSQPATLAYTGATVSCNRVHANLTCVSPCQSTYYLFATSKLCAGKCRLKQIKIMM